MWMKQTVLPSRRSNSRCETPEGIWVYWRCNGRDDIARIRDVSLGGLFIETSKVWPVDSRAEIDFLVQEGQIRAKAVVKHTEHGRGLGLKFIALRDQDRPHLIALMQRLRSLRAA